MVDQSMKRAVLGLFAALASLGAAPAFARDVPVAVAANFTEPAKEIAAAFKAATGDTAVLSFGASGQFYTQISHGAPFEVFLSADGDRPKKAEQDGLGVPGTRFTYATGTAGVVLQNAPVSWMAPGRCWPEGDFQKLSIADPASAPYGTAAIQTMKHLGLYDRLKPKVVQGSSITQGLSVRVHRGGGAGLCGPVAGDQPTGRLALAGADQ